MKNATCFGYDRGFGAHMWGVIQLDPGDDKHLGCRRDARGVIRSCGDAEARHGAFDASKAIATMGWRHPISLLPPWNPHRPRSSSAALLLLCFD